MSETCKAGVVLDATVEKMKAMADASVIVGEPIQLGDTTLIPVSKVAYGFASGGSDLKSSNNAFAGGGGGAMTVTPVAFLVQKDGEVRLLNITPAPTAGPMGAAERAVAMAPELIDQIAGLIRKDPPVETAAPEESV